MKEKHIRPRIEVLTKRYLEQALHMQNRIFRENASEKYLEDLMQNPNYVYLLLLHKEEVIGILYYMKTAFEAELIDIAMDERYRGSGFGTLLLEEMIARTENSDIGEIFLEVRKSNAPAIAMYQKAGFSKVGERRNYYSNPCEDAVLMKRENKRFRSGKE